MSPAPRTRALLAKLSWVLVSTGLVVVLFGIYQLWGTGVRASIEQRERRAELRRTLAGPHRGPTTTAGTAVPSAVPSTSPPVSAEPPAPGDAIAEISIPALGLRQTVVEGVGADQLRGGPGHYPHTVLPGHFGNVALAGHRTTYGGPFGRLDELGPGAPITLRTAEGEFTYLVTRTEVVAPADITPVLRADEPLLTLTTCHPKFSARQRLIVVATLSGPSLEERALLARPEASGPPAQGSGPAQPARSAVPRQPVPDHLDGGDAASARGFSAGLVFWGATTAAGGWLWRQAFRRRRRATTWLAGVPPVCGSLLFFYAEVEQVLPPNF